MDGAIKKTRKPTVAGILDIIIGCLILGILFIFSIGPMIIEPVQAGLFPFNLSLSFFIVVPAIIIASLAIISGIFAIQRRKWRWALAGSIAAAIGPTPLGIAAIVLVALSKNEFK